MSSSIFDLDEFKPFADQWGARQQEFARRESYYDGSVYTGALAGLSWMRPRAGAAIRPLYLPLSRAVNVDAGIIPGDWSLALECKGLQAARDQVFQWSGWQQDGVLFVHYGSLYGCSGLQISDLREQGRVIISPVSPMRFMLIGSGLYDQTPQAAIVCERRQTTAAIRLDTGIKEGTFEYAEVITASKIRTFANGMLCPFDGRPASYWNLLGFVPLVEVKHINTGAAICDCAFEKVIPLLDQVNRLASELASVIHRFQDPQYVITGAEKPTSSGVAITPGCCRRAQTSRSWSRSSTFPASWPLSRNRGRRWNRGSCSSGSTRSPAPTRSPPRRSSSSSWRSGSMCGAPARIMMSVWSRPCAWPAAQRQA